MNNDAENGSSPETPEDPRGVVTAAHIRKEYDRGIRAMRKSTNEYELADSFLSGEQWLYRDPVRNSLQQLPREPSRVRVSVNRLWPASRTLMAKLLSRPLQFEVQPTDSDDATTTGAYTAEAALAHLHREHMWEQVREEHAWSTWKGGTAALALDWDPSGGRSLGIVSEKGKPVATGDIVEAVLSVSEFVVEPGTRNAERSNWWIRAQALPPAEVQERYRLTNCPKPDAAPGTTPAGRLTQGDGQSQLNDLTLVLTYYERPNSRRPQGSVATVVGEQMVDGPHPWSFPFRDRLNLVVARETVVPGRWYGDTVLQAAIPVQVAFNASWSTIIEHMKLAGNARLMIPEGSMDLMDELTDLPSEILPYVSGQGAPGFLSPPQMPQWWIEQPVLLAQEMDDILGIHDVTRGNAPRNIESGAGLAILAEADSTPLGRLTKELADAWGRFASLVLQVYASKVEDTRKSRVVIPGQGIETIEWTGTALMGQTEAIVPLDAVMPRNRAAMMKLAMDMWNGKVITDPVQFARVADFARQDQFIDALDPDVSKARWENHQMAQGKIVLPNDFDDHAVHIQEHNNFRKSRRYASLSPDRQAIFDNHIKAHEIDAHAEAGKQYAKTQMMAAAGGIPTANEAVLPQLPGSAPSGPLAGGPPGLAQAVAAEKQQPPPAL